MNKEIEKPDFSKMQKPKNTSSLVWDSHTRFIVGAFIIAAILLILLFASGSNSKNCVERADTPHGWDKDIYHHCMETPKGFRW